MPQSTLPADIEAMTFEEALEELEALATTMHEESLTLEESVKAFTRARALSAKCKALLATARETIKKFDTEAGLVGVDDQELASDD
ncbi:MAG TPA: exodeoxyribonuclease VII small subunit [Sutterella sp.]|nr:exodeoxyribonuclease VII small subunit [Sutterella sp.]